MSRLKDSGIKTAIVTNGHAGIQRAKLQRVGGEELCDALLLGGEEILAGRQEKPDAGIFLAACQMCECQPSQVCVRVECPDCIGIHAHCGVLAGPEIC